MSYAEAIRQLSPAKSSDELAFLACSTREAADALQRVNYVVTPSGVRPT